MDYRKLIGVQRLPAAVTHGRGVRIAILDSGIPPVSRLRRRMPDAPSNLHDQEDRLGHATAVASILFGGRGLTGLCELATALYLKVLDDTGCGLVDTVSAGIQTALEHGADIINLSLGFVRTESCPRALEHACRLAFESGVPVICAAGNDGGPVNWPAALPQTISVGAAGVDGLQTAYSSIGTRRGEIDVIAPGENLPVLNGANRVSTVSGTSFAAALITGLAALLIAEEKDRQKTISCEEIRYKIRSLATDVGAEGWDVLTGFGIIGGKYRDPTVRQKICGGFFAKIVENIRGLLGLGQKEKQHGRV